MLENIHTFFITNCDIGQPVTKSSCLVYTLAFLWHEVDWFVCSRRCFNERKYIISMFVLNSKNSKSSYSIWKFNEELIRKNTHKNEKKTRMLQVTILKTIRVRLFKFWKPRSFKNCDRNGFISAGSIWINYLYDDLNWFKKSIRWKKSTSLLWTLEEGEMTLSRHLQRNKESFVIMHIKLY